MTLQNIWIEIIVWSLASLINTRKSILWLWHNKISMCTKFQTSLTPWVPGSSCDTRMGGCWTYGLLIPCSPYVQHPPIRKTFAPVNLSLLHFTQDINIQISPFWTKCVKLTLTGCHRATMALRGLHVSHTIVQVSYNEFDNMHYI